MIELDKTYDEAKNEFIHLDWMKVLNALVWNLGEEETKSRLLKGGEKMGKVDLPAEYDDALKEMSFDPLPETDGLTFEITAVKPMESQAGEAMLMFICEVLTEGDLKERRAPYFAMLEGKGWPFGMVRIAHATQTPWVGLSLDTDDYVGKTFECDIGLTEDRQGNPRNDWKFGDIS